MTTKNPTARSMWNFSLWWAMAGSNWFRSEHILKEQSDAQMIVSADAGGYMTAEKKGKRQEKRPHEADHMRSSFWWAMTGSNCRHSACKADALPAELIAHKSLTEIIMP